MIWGAMMWEDAIYRRDPHVNSGERSVSVHYPQHLAHTNGQPASCIFYDAIPDWYTATIPRMAIPTDLTGTNFFWQHFRPSSTILFQRLPGRSLYGLINFRLQKIDFWHPFPLLHAMQKQFLLNISN